MVEYIKTTIFVLFSAIIAVTYGCIGYSLQMKTLTTCNEQSLLKIHKGFSVNLTKNCVVMPKGCIEATKGFKKAVIHCDVKKGLLVHKLDKDCCKGLEKPDPETTAILNVLGLPQKCPMKKQKQCVKEGIDISAQKGNLMFIEGSFSGTCTIDHGDAGKSCIKFQGSLNKKSLFG